MARALVLPNHAKWVSAEKRNLAARGWQWIRSTLSPAIVDRGKLERAGDYKFRVRAIQYAAWLARRDNLTIHDPDLYQGDFEPSTGIVELYFHATSTRCEDLVRVKIPNLYWSPGPVVITECDPEPAPAALEGPTLALEHLEPIKVKAARPALPLALPAPIPARSDAFPVNSPRFWQSRTNGLNPAEEFARRIFARG